MNYLYILIPFLCSIVLIIFLIKKINKENKALEKIILEKKEIEQLKKGELKEYFNEEWEVQQKELNNKFKLKETEIGGRIGQLEATLKEKEKRYIEVNQDLDLYREGKIKEIDSAAAEYEQRKQLIINQSIEKYRDFQIEYANNKMAVTKEEIDKANEELIKILEELEVERRKRAAINEEIRKTEEKEKYNEIHSVQLTDNEKEDIHFLLSLEDRLHNKQALYKLVWSTYLQQAYKNTFHNILGNRDPRNVIYCIENIETGKKYIGKTSAEVSKRWTEHVKTSLNIGTIKTTNIHKALYNHWDEFIFYILAETEKEKLSEMEKYYIGFYESDKYGYNIKAGG